MLLGAMLFSVGSLTSCKDYSDDIDALNGRVSVVETEIGRVQNQLESAINTGLSIEECVQIEGGWKLLMSDGTEIKIADSKGIYLLQFKVCDGYWMLSKDKGNLWELVKTAQGTQIAASAETNVNIHFDESTGTIFIGDVQTNLTCDKNDPILAHNNQNKTLYVCIGGESYLINYGASSFSGISSIIYRKKYFSESDEYLEAAVLKKSDEILYAAPAIAEFKILPAKIDLSEATYACTDIHKLLTTRAGSPTLDVQNPEFQNGILRVNLVPNGFDSPTAGEEASYYGASLEITLENNVTGSDYFVVKPTERQIEDAKLYMVVNNGDSDSYAALDDENALTVEESQEGFDLNKNLRVSFPVAEDEYLDLSDVIPADKLQMNYEVSGEGFQVTDGVLTGSSESPVILTVTCTIDGKVAATYSCSLKSKSSGVVYITSADPADLVGIYPLGKSDLNVVLDSKDLKLEDLTAECYALGIKSGVNSYTKVEGVTLAKNESALQLSIAKQTGNDGSNTPEIPLFAAGSNLYVLDGNGNLQAFGANRSNICVTGVTIYKYIEVVEQNKAYYFGADVNVCMPEGYYLFGEETDFGKINNVSKRQTSSYAFNGVELRKFYTIIPSDLDVNFEMVADYNTTYGNTTFSINENKLSLLNNFNASKVNWTVGGSGTLSKPVGLKIKKTVGSQPSEDIWYVFDPLYKHLTLDNFIRPTGNLSYSGEKLAANSTIDFKKVLHGAIPDFEKLACFTQTYNDDRLEAYSNKPYLNYDSGTGFFKESDLVLGQRYYRAGLIFQFSGDGIKDAGLTVNPNTGIITCTGEYDSTKECVLTVDIYYQGDLVGWYLAKNIKFTIPAQNR